MTVSETCSLAKANERAIAYRSEGERNAMLALAAEALVGQTDFILRENAADIVACSRGEQFKDRLLLTRGRIEAIAEGLKKLCALACPVGEEVERFTAQSGLDITRVRVPFGTVGIIYEARPNVTADAIGLCIKSGNAVVLRGSKDAFRSNAAIVGTIKAALRGGDFNSEFIQLIQDGTREGAAEFMRQKKYIDVLIPAEARRSSTARWKTRPYPSSKRARETAIYIWRNLRIFPNLCPF